MQADQGIGDDLLAESADAASETDDAPIVPRKAPWAKRLQMNAAPLPAINLS